MTDHNPIRSCPNCGRTILALPDADGTGHYDELPHDAVPAEQRRVWLGSVGVVPLPHHWPQPATVLRRHHCTPAPDAVPGSNPERHDEDGTVSSADLKTETRVSGEPQGNPATDEVHRSGWGRASMRAQLVELNRLRTVMTLYRAQQTGQLRPHPGQRTYEPVTVPTALAEAGRLSPTRCPLCTRQLSADTSTIVAGSIGTSGDQPLSCCAPACANSPRR